MINILPTQCNKEIDRTPVDKSAFRNNKVFVQDLLPLNERFQYIG